MSGLIVAFERGPTVVTVSTDHMGLCIRSGMHGAYVRDPIIPAPHVRAGLGRIPVRMRLPCAHAADCM